MDGKSLKAGQIGPHLFGEFHSMIWSGSTPSRKSSLSLEVFFFLSLSFFGYFSVHLRKHKICYLIYVCMYKFACVSMCLCVCVYPLDHSLVMAKGLV